MVQKQIKHNGIMLLLAQLSNHQINSSIGEINLNETNKIKCPCCGKTNVGEYDICNVCGWENDPVQLRKPDFKGGANKMSLEEARQAYIIGMHVV